MFKKRENTNLNRILLIIVIIFLIFVIYIYFQNKESLLLAPSDHSVTRSFDKNMVLPNEDVTVTLTVDTWDGNDNVYTIDERIPPQLQIVSAGDGTISGNKIKWAIYNSGGSPVVDTTHTYVVRSTNLGTYDLNGKYMFNSERPPTTIPGDTQFQILSCVPTAEICDGLDNDCDSVIDNGFEPDTCQGTCENQGFTWTNNGANLNCCGDDITEDSPFQISESSPLNLCSDGNDNDCDGNIDSADSDCYACTPGIDTQSCVKQDGVCSGSEEICNPQGQWDGCSDSTYLTYNPNYEQTEANCDNLDNDCDASIDETPDLLCEYLGAYTCLSGTCECNSIYEEDSLLFTGDCNGCVSPVELSNYIYEWKVLDNLEITQEEVTVSIDEYLLGVRLC